MIARCPYCSAGIAASQAFCTSCGRSLTGAAPGFPNQPGMYAPAQAMPAPLMPGYPAPQLAQSFQPPAQTAQASKEKVHIWIWLGNLISIGIGGWVIYDHWQGTVGLGVALALFALAALSLGVSRLGTRWKRASCLEKLLILPGVLAGLVVLAAVVLSGMSSDSNQDSKESSHSKSDHSDSDGGGDNPFESDSSGDNSIKRRIRANPFIRVCPYCGQPALRSIPVCPHCRQPLP